MLAGCVNALTDSRDADVFCVREVQQLLIRSQFSIHLASDSRNDLRHGLDIRSSGVEVHDAGAQHIAAADDGVGDECLASALQPIEQLAVERVEVTFDRRLSQVRSKIARHVAERRDAQVLGRELQFRMAADRLSHRLRQADIVRDHLAIPRGSDLLQGKPHFEGTEAARVLRAVVDVVRRLLLEMIVGRVIREGGAQRFRIAHQRASGLERRVEPFVRINRDRIGQRQTA